MIIMFGHEKGGVGKSTLADNFAFFVASDPRKLKVVLVDADESGNTTRWCELREQNGLPTDFVYVNLARSGTTNILKLSEQYDVVIVDVGAGDYERLIEMARIVDLWIAPTGVGQKDQDSNVNVIEAARSAHRKHKNGKIPLVFAFNKTPAASNSTEASANQEALREYAPDIKVLDSIVCDRKVFRDADRAGKSIFEMPLSQRAKAEADFVQFAAQAFQAQQEFMKEAANG